MEKSKLKIPQKNGGKLAAQIFERTRKKIPSDALVKIISEIPELESDQKKILDNVAKDLEI